MATAARTTERTSEPPHLRLRQRLRELWDYREVLLNLVRKELKVKYIGSVLGAVWSLLNPVVFLAVFTFVAKVLGASVDDYPVFLLSGLLAWNLFAVSLSTGAQSVVANANLVKKVYFPREILPLATVGVALVDFVLQSIVYLAFLVVIRYGFVLGSIWLYPLAFALLVWFWLTPIVYAAGKTHEQIVSGHWWGPLAWRIYLLNPTAWIVFGFQRALYHSPDANAVLAPFTTSQLGVGLCLVIVILLVLLYATWRIFFGLSGDFAEEL
ncbi:MAG: ABC transporter permease [Actinobacteria bacterium]|nr:MAG: ABC transporter permease [Actinomycetota bacterium]